MEKVPGEPNDHPHHHSLWVAHGDVNGTDDWSISNESGSTKQDQLTDIAQGQVCGEIISKNVWLSKDKKPLLNDLRKITIWGMPETGRYIDFDLTFTAEYGDAKFGDTKEGGLVAFRVAHTMQVEREDKKPGGTIINANGDKDGNAWGKAAAWCDYSGPVDNTVAGLTIMDSPKNIFYPTYFHVRTYGLFTANPFGLSAFKNDKKLDGGKMLKKGESWHLQYRVYVHKGNAEEAKVKQAYNGFAEPPVITLR